MKLKALALGLLALGMSFASVTANAADLPRPSYKSPVYVAPVFSWSGFYLGINGGYGRGSSQWTGGAGNFEVSPSGWMLGGTVGYNIQTGNWVWGVEGDINYMNLKGTGDACAGCTIKDTWLGTARGRVGMSFDRWLPYLTGGLAYGNVYVSTPGGAVDRTKAGWTAGAGVEYAFAANWSAKLEYLYVDLGSTTCEFSTCAIPSDASVTFKQNIIRAGLNYRF